MNITRIGFSLDKTVQKNSFGNKTQKSQQVANTTPVQTYKKLSPQYLQSISNISFGTSVAKLSAEDISWLKGRLTPAQFEKARKLFYLPQKEDKQFSKEDILIVARMDDKKFEKAQKLLQIPKLAKGMGGYDISTLTDLGFLDLRAAINLMQIPQRGEKQFSGTEAAMIVQLNRNDFKNAKKFFYVPERGQRQFSAYDICYDLGKLNDEQVKKAQRLYYSPKREDKQFEGGEICAIAKLKDEQYRTAQEFFYIPQRGNRQFDGYEIAKLAKMDDDSLNLAKHLIYNPKYQMPKDGFCREMMTFALDNGLVSEKELQEPLSAFKIAAITARFQQQAK